MTKKSPESPDPFSLFGNIGGDNPFEDWDPFSESLEQFESDSTNSNFDPFAMASFTKNKLLVNHRRTTSSPPRAISPYSSK